MTSRLKHFPFLRLWVSITGLMVALPLGTAEPQGNKANWENLKELASGQEIRVVLNDAKSFQGQFQSMSDESLVIGSAAGEQTFNKPSVLRVSFKGQGHRLRNAAIGAAIGFGVGAAIGAAWANPGAYCCGRGVSAAVAGAGGLAIGGVTGAALPTGGWRDVYRAR
jgi:thiamine pyrophosphate-dependent acetolactate synthase large subunit-like protein